MPYYAVVLYRSVDADHALGDADPADPGREPYDRHAQDLQSSGSLLAAFELEPAFKAQSIRAKGMTDGPFTEAKEVIAGFCVLDAPDREAALAIARSNPILADGGGVEVREVLGAALPGV
jgi:hypothetical protein